ncbi:ATP-grasp domain-containing protein [Nocardioides perillae]|uniref:Glutathione synthase/RimK-type ligase-like ATP-grasp enzyme n=1 Tax=Nocardioides perillae TaxID=1119534 RepID=A0A7Y9RT91_9ACTN|nr:hypothetical protein [Nocardioides perillae]NYG54841.1 glutathione synthase/RimK-type ligase-like ATP-grasp enzyme [Nocardioides perillae]
MSDDVLLATCALLPDGETGGELLLRALAAEGLDARWVRWDDETVAWGDAALVAARSTWDYQRRVAEFLAWARRVEAEGRLLNGAEVFAWNTDKAYLLELEAAGLPVVPSRLLDERTLVEGLTAALDTWGEVLVKPRTGAGGVGVVVCDSLRDERLEGLVAAPWLVQPVVPAVRTEGETSVYVLDGRVVAQVDKRPAGGEVRVHELYGGSSRRTEPTDEAAAVAARAVEVATALPGLARDGAAPDLAYARVDLMRWEGALVVSELELIEPGLYLDVVPEVATSFAALVRARLDAA